MANPYFNAQYYLAQNPDLLAAGINTVDAAWAHYVNYGASEALNGASSRSPAPWFDVQYYLSANPDLLTSGLTGAQLFEHFVTYGINEGRVPSANAAQMTDASLLAYAKGNADLATAFGVAADATSLTDAQRDGLANHFYEYGYKEGRADAPFTPDTNPGQTFTLTTGVDSISSAGATLNNGATTVTAPGAGNDTLNAVVATTLQVSDSIDLAGGTNTANLINAANQNVDLTTVPYLRNVQVLNYTDVEAANANAVDAVVLPQLTTFNVNGSLAGVTLNNATSTIGTFGISNIATKDAGNLTVNYVAGQNTGTADAATLNLSSVAAQAGAGAGDFATIAFAGAAANQGVETLNVVATGTNRVDAITSADNAASTLTALNISGTGSLRIDNALDFAGTGAITGTVDASKNSGGVTVTLGAGENVKFVGGSGNDRVNAVATLTSGDVLDGGTGTNTISQDAIASVALANYTNVTNFQTLAITGQATGTLDTSLVPASITTFAMEGGVAAGFTGASKLVSGDTVTFNSIDNTVTDATFALATATGTADALNLKVTKQDADKAFTKLTATGFETINLDVRTGTNATVNTLTLTQLIDADLTTLTITGDEQITLGGAAWSTGNLTTLNASGVNKAVTVTGDVQFNNSGASLSTGAGTDAITFSVATNATLAVNAGEQTVNTLGDTLNLTGAQTGNTTVDLSSTTDQITKVNGANNAPVQVGFENVSAAAVTGAGTLTLTGSAGTNVITASTAGTGKTTITGGDGVDFISVANGAAANASVDTIVVSATTAANADIITGFSGGAGADVFKYTGTLVNGTGTAADGIAASEVLVQAAGGDATGAATIASALAANANAVVYQFQLAASAATAGTTGLNAINTLADLGDAIAFADIADFATNATALVNTLVGANGYLNGTIAGLDATLTTTDSVLFVIGGQAADSNSVVLRITNTDTTTANTLTAAEVQVVGVFNDVNTAVFAADNFVWAV